jgi:tetratricopeptide (TPR) repeat protein
MEDAVRRAANAALAIRTLVMRARAGAPVRPELKLALHMDLLPVARVADDFQLQDGARRTAVAALEALARRVGAGEIAVSGTAGGALARTFVLEPVPGVEAAFRLVGHANPALSRFVGRDRELALLLERVEMARAGQGQVVVLVGEPGIGKSRLLLELRRRIGSDVAWLEGQAMPFGRSMPFHPIIGMLRRSYRIDDGDTDRIVGDKLEHGVTRLGEDLRSTLPFLRDLLSLDPDDPAVAAMDPQRRHAEIVTATHRLLERAAERRPHVIVLEDGHWMDAATEGWLRLLADRVAAKPVLVILTCRPGYSPPFGDHTFHTRLAIPALSAGDSAELAQSLLDVEALPGAVQALVARKAEGNPFFVEEMVKSLEEVGAVRREGRRLLVARSLEAVDVPDTIQDVVLARIGRLRADARNALQLASVIGREFTRRLLDRLVDAPARLDEILGELKAMELVYEKTLFPEQVYVFKHGLIRLVAYGTLAAGRRRELHRRIGMAVEELYADRLAEHYGLLAYHFVRGEDWTRALDYLLKAADRAARTSAIQEAIALYDEALEAARHAPAADTSAAVMTIHQAKAALHFVVSDFRESRAEAERLLELARRAGDRAREADALAAIAWAATWARDLDGAVSFAEQAIQVASAVPVEAALARSHFTIGFVSAVTGKLEAGREHLGRAVSRARLAGDHVHHSLALLASGLVKSWEGDYEAGGALQADALVIARRHDLLLPLLFGLFVHGLTLTGRGDYDAALTGYREGLALAERIGDEAIHHRLLNCQGWLHLELGDLDSALTLNQRSAEVARRRKDPGTIPNAELNLGDVFLARGDLPLARELYEGIDRYAGEPSTSEWMRFRYTIRLEASSGALWLARGDLERACRHAERCLDAATRTDSRKNLVKGWRLTGEIAQARRRWDDAEQALRRALAVAEAIGNPPQLWLTHLALARLSSARGRADEARREAARGEAVVAAVLSQLRDEPLRASLARAAAVQELRALAAGAPASER